MCIRDRAGAAGSGVGEFLAADRLGIHGIGGTGDAGDLRECDEPAAVARFDSCERNGGARFVGSRTHEMCIRDRGVAEHDVGGAVRAVLVGGMDEASEIRMKFQAVEIISSDQFDPGAGWIAARIETCDRCV